MSINFLLSDAVEWAKDYKGELFHSLMCDPPYHLTSIVKRFGKEGSAPAKFGTDGVFARSSGGFMGKQWDGGDVAFRPETWAAFANVLHDGAFGFAFASSRGWHRLAVAIEDAGLIIHPSVFGWLYGSGFPKATRLNHGHEMTEAFAGHRYGLQALKPALEPIIVFQKPYAGRPIDCITRTGAGVLNVDGGRIGTETITTTAHKDLGSNGIYGHSKPFGESEPRIGRWPANFYLGSEEAARRLDAQSGELKSGAKKAGQPAGIDWHAGSVSHERNGGRPAQPRDVEGSTGGASRFFYNVREQIDDADPVRYVAKASRRERDAGLDGFELKLAAKMDGGDFIPYGRNIDNTKAQARNPHPTVKPLSLTRYLATLLLPPAEYAPRRLFVPFAGVGSEAIGAMQAGWEFVQGVEITEEYLPIAQARAEYWENKDKQMEMEL